MMGATLVTGADGYLGARVAAALSARGAPLVLWARASSASERERKAALLTEMLGPAVEARDVRFGDLTDDAPFSGIDPSSLSAIVHCAAVTRFNVDAGTADAVNVCGAARVFDFAERCPRLDRLVFLSTLYASGLQAGPIEEEPLRTAAFRQRIRAVQVGGGIGADLRSSAPALDGAARGHRDRGQ